MAINYLKWRAWPFISKNIIPLHLKILFGKFDWKGRVVLEMKIFNSFSYNVFYFAIISNWKRAWPFICTNLNPLYSRMLCTKFGWNWQSGSGIEDFWKFFPIIFNISLIISPWRRHGFSFVQTWNPSTQKCFMPSLVEIGPVVLEEIFKYF